MGLPSVAGVIKMLREAGIRADRGYSGSKMPQLDSVAAAVNMQLYDTASRLVTVAVEVWGPVSHGAAACENMAVNVCHILSAQGAACRQGACGFDSGAGYFYAVVTATWHSPAKVEELREKLPYRVEIDGVNRDYAIGFTAKQTVELETVGAIGEDGDKQILSRDQGWQFTLEELFPEGQMGDDACAEPFTLRVVRYNGVETFTNCYWASLQRKDTSDGVNQTRVGWTKNREARILG